MVIPEIRVAIVWRSALPRVRCWRSPPWTHGHTKSGSAWSPEKTHTKPGWACPLDIGAKTRYTHHKSARAPGLAHPSIFFHFDVHEWIGQQTRTEECPDCDT